MQYQKEDVRKRIVDAAKTEFLRVGFYRASMLQISNRARVPIGNLYRYFASKEALFDSIVGTAKERILEVIKGGLGLTVKSDALPKQETILKMDKVSDNFLEIARDYQKEMILLLQKSNGSKHDGFIEEVVGYVKDLLNERVKDSNDTPHEFLFDLIADNVTRGAFRIMIERPFEEQREELTRLFTFYFANIEDRLY
ncbi:MAG: TetR/AcrR family transcriptional regulator [Clostridia bacterium]|nr:TetR/AcrR family transcriptional regulator [Clostridia bacterium]